MNYLTAQPSTSTLVAESLFGSTRTPKIPVISNIWIHVWSIKYRLIMKLIAQLATNLRDKSFKPN